MLSDGMEYRRDDVIIRFECTISTLMPTPKSQPLSSSALFDSHISVLQIVAVFDVLKGL